MIKSSAPGKLMLFGEYGVLEGGPAVLIAVNRRAHVSISSAERATVTSPGFINEPAFFSYRKRPQTGTGVSDTAAPSLIWEWESADMAKRLRLVSTIGEQLLPVVPTESLKIELDTQELFDGPNKLGLGSSAALCVALSGALAHYADTNISLEHCQQLHHSFQGSGSGADVATCFTGGVIIYRTGNDPLPISIPEGLHLACVWTGISSSTQSMLSQLHSYQQAEPQGYRLLMDSLLGAAKALIVRNLSLSAWLEGILHFTAELKVFATQTNLPVFRSPHLALGDLARQFGVVYKPVGAGGGDLGLLLTDSAKVLASCCAKIEQQGFRTLRPEIARNGLDVRI